MIHIAILLKPYLDLILEGKKTIECRLTIQNRAPYERIEPGERVYFKQSAGPYRATAIAEHVMFADELTPAKIRRVRKDYNHAILGDNTYWNWKKTARYLSLIWLTEVEPTRFGPRVNPQRGIAWLVRDDSFDVYPDCLKSPAPAALPPRAFAVPLTEANLKYRHVYLSAVKDQFPEDAFGGATKEDPGRSVSLQLEKGPVIETDIVGTKNIFRVRRSWGGWFAEQQARSGDELVFIPRGRRRYDVQLRRSVES